MEREANYVAVGAFVLLITAMAVLFVYWYSDTLANIVRNPQPWIHAYFQGPRARQRGIDHGA